MNGHELAWVCAEEQCEGGRSCVGTPLWGKPAPASQICTAAGRPSWAPGYAAHLCCAPHQQPQLQLPDGACLVLFHLVVMTHASGFPLTAGGDPCRRKVRRRLQFIRQEHCRVRFLLRTCTGARSSRAATQYRRASTRSAAQPARPPRQPLHGSLALQLRDGDPCKSLACEQAPPADASGPLCACSAGVSGD